MGDGTRLWKLRRADVAREIRSLRRSRRHPGIRGTGLLVAFWPELGMDVGRLVGLFGLSVKPRKRKGVT